jgi:hypothetical protein
MPIEISVELPIELPVKLPVAPADVPLLAAARGAKGSHASNEIFPRGLSY